MHPEIPAEMSDRAKHFILRCFEPDPDRRATAAELMEENFLSELVLIFCHFYRQVRLFKCPFFMFFFKEEKNGTASVQPRIQP